LLEDALQELRERELRWCEPSLPKLIEPEAGLAVQCCRLQWRV
jgi:hypothetical protein